MQKNKNYRGLSTTSHTNPKEIKYEFIEKKLKDEDTFLRQQKTKSAFLKINNNGICSMNSQKV